MSNILPDKVRAMDPSLILNGLRVTSALPLVTGQVGCMQERDPSLITHPRDSHTQCR